MGVAHLRLRLSEGVGRAADVGGVGVCLGGILEAEVLARSNGSFSPRVTASRQ